MKNIYRFLEFAESLKLVRNDQAEIDGRLVIDDIYTDLLPNEGVITKVSLPRTTILVGRKGTGKSTIFQKAQSQIDKNRKYLSIYIDVKSLYDNSTPKLPTEISSLPDSEELTKYLIYSNFIREIILKTKDKLRKRVEVKYGSILKITGLSEMMVMDAYYELDKIEDAIDDIFKELNASLVTSFRNTIETGSTSTTSGEVSVGSDTTFSAKLGGNSGNSTNLKKEFDNKLVTYLDLKKCFIDNLVKIREILKVKNLYIFLDDYSEIDKNAQTIFMDWFIAPVNNLSEDFVKFKIATYPKRFYYGKLDNSKIDEISLDFFDAYYTIEKKNDVIDISRMEHLALDYTKRLLQNRIELYFKDDNWKDYFDINPSELYELLFNSTLNTPRKMGYLLSYCFESCLIHGVKIGISAIENASARYYSEIVEKYFLLNEYICKPFSDGISNDHQFELLNLIIKKQSTNSKYLLEDSSKPSDASHFFINNDLAYLLDNLELNGFLSTYNKIKDSNNVFSTVYSLDFGMCKMYDLAYGRPGEANSNSHILPPLLNFNNLIVDYFNSTQVIRCEKGHEFPYSEIDQFRRYKMKCPNCMEENLIIPCNVMMKFIDLKEKFLEQEENEKFKISFHEYLILNLMKVSQTSISYQRMSSTLDISQFSVAQLVARTIEAGWAELDIAAGIALKKELVKITPKGARRVEKIDRTLQGIREQRASKG